MCVSLFFFFFFKHHGSREMRLYMFQVSLGLCLKKYLALFFWSANMKTLHLLSLLSPSDQTFWESYLRNVFSLSIAKSERKDGNWCLSANCILARHHASHIGLF